MTTPSQPPEPVDTKHTVAQNELADEFAEVFKVRKIAIAKWRREHLAEEDWEPGFRGKIYWTREAELRLRIWAEEPKLTSAIFRVRVIRLAINPQWVYAILDQEKIAVAIPRRLAGRIKPNQTIEIEEIQNDQGRSYRHISLSR